MGGYPRLIRDYLAAREPATAPRVMNMGISGNKVTDLLARWQSDVLAHRPDVLSIKIGINDVWHGLNRDNPAGVPIERFVPVYRQILSDYRRECPAGALVLCQPSVIEPPAPSEGNAVLQPYVQAVNELAGEFGATLVRLHDAFVSARKARPDINWTPDGVHPSSVGHMLIARTWLDAMGLL